MSNEDAKLLLKWSKNLVRAIDKQIKANPELMNGGLCVRVSAAKINLENVLKSVDKREG
jgi:hypothetical protein